MPRCLEILWAYSYENSSISRLIFGSRISSIPHIESILLPISCDYHSHLHELVLLKYAYFAFKFKIGLSL
jgi:hypothetical protein